MDKIPLNWVCWGNNSGYSQAAQDLILALELSGKYDVRVQFIYEKLVQRKGMTDERWEFFQKLCKKPKNENSIQVYHCIPSAQRHVPRLKKTIGFATFETFDPPNEGNLGWINILNRNDAIITPSDFNFRIFAHEKLKKPLFKVPHVFDQKLFNPEVEPLEEHSRFTFLFFGAWRVRKGYQELIEAWCREFTAQDNVQLIIKTDKTQKAKTVIQKIKNNLGYLLKDIAPILFENKVFDELTLPRFLKSAHCLISPTRGEGFGLPGLQCMALDVPVAITDFSGCQDYANDETCTLIKPAGFVLHPCMDNLPQFRNKKWASIETREVCRVLRHVYENMEDVKRKAKMAVPFVQNKFGYDNAVSAFSEIMRETYGIKS